MSLLTFFIILTTITTLFVFIITDDIQDFKIKISVSIIVSLIINVIGLSIALLITKTVEYLVRL